MDTSHAQAQLRAEIAASGRTAKSFAEAAGINYLSLMRYMKGDRDIPLGTLMSLLAALQLSPTDFFERVEARSR